MKIIPHIRGRENPHAKGVDCEERAKIGIRRSLLEHSRSRSGLARTFFNRKLSGKERVTGNFEGFEAFK